jgi:hypothetical protein
VTAALLVLLTVSAPLRSPDLQIEAKNAAGANLPELADAVARALVASGVRVVLGGPASEPCIHCVQVRITNAGQGAYRIDVSQERHTATVSLRFDVESSLFDRARAVAIQARSLVTWESSPNSKAKEAVARQPARKPEPRGSVEITGRVAPSAEPQPLALAPKEPEPLPATLPEAARVPMPGPPAIPRPDLAAALKPPSPPARPEHPLPQAELSGKIRSSSLASKQQRWPWIPIAVGSGAAIAAGICAIVARNRYDALSDKSRPFDQASALKTEGERWQIASYALTGAAVAGLATGLIGFVARGSEPPSVTASAAPIPGGGIIAFAGSLP